jgi:hypothetical protein
LLSSRNSAHCSKCFALPWSRLPSAILAWLEAINRAG